MTAGRVQLGIAFGVTSHSTTVPVLPAGSSVRTTNHPFCSGMGPYDVRLTTRYDENELSGSLFSTLHEAGHGSYDQGLRKERYGLPTGEAVSLGIHESQSRMWENFVGRSRSFWKFFMIE